TQALYVVVFCTRYLDLFDRYWYKNMWNFTLKIFYISSSIYILILMMRVYARTREREKAWKLGGYSLAGSLILAPIVTLIFEPRYNWRPTWVRTSIKSLPTITKLNLQMLWAFSEILESVCVLPQLLLLRQTTIPTVIDSFYLLTLGSYRGFYCLNWIWRAAGKDMPDAISVIFGVIQIIRYI